VKDAPMSLRQSSWHGSRPNGTNLSFVRFLHVEKPRFPQSDRTFAFRHASVGLEHTVPAVFDTPIIFLSRRSNRLEHPDPLSPIPRGI
jgi:hypothetical protein